jgi:hypothetical protein
VGCLPCDVLDVFEVCVWYTEGELVLKNLTSEELQDWGESAGGLPAM